MFISGVSGFRAIGSQPKPGNPRFAGPTVYELSRDLSLARVALTSRTNALQQTDENDTSYKTRHRLMQEAQQAVDIATLSEDPERAKEALALRKVAKEATKPHDPSYKKRDELLWIAEEAVKIASERSSQHRDSQGKRGWNA